MSNKKRINRKIRSLQNRNWLSPSKLEGFSKCAVAASDMADAFAYFAKVIQRVNQRVANMKEAAIFLVPKPAPKRLEGMMAFAANDQGIRKTVHAGSREFNPLVRAEWVRDVAIKQLIDRRPLLRYLEDEINRKSQGYCDPK